MGFVLHENSINRSWQTEYPISNSRCRFMCKLIKNLHRHSVSTSLSRELVLG